ncbi:MAG TPA: hypothetical protein VNX28_05585 [Gemmataceae bacterium]|jgi:hypothetical protein|nr:hypothetical protein [Gemmataceae bacterium]
MKERKVRRGDKVYEMKVKARDEATTSATPSAPAATDMLGIPLPESRALVFTAHGDFREAQDLFDRLLTLFYSHSSLLTSHSFFWGGSLFVACRNGHIVAITSLHQIGYMRETS